MRSALLLLLGACLPTVPADDDTTAPGDDDNTPSDDDSTAIDDDSTTDDDSSADDDSTPGDDDTTPEPTPTPSTFVEILDPVPGEMLLAQPFVLQTDGDQPGLSRWTLDGEEVDLVFVNPTTLQTDFVVDTAQWPDGDYTLAVELLSWDLGDSVAVQVNHGDLLVYELGSVPLDADVANQQTLDGWVTPPAVSVQPQIWIPDNLSPEWLGSYLLDPNNDWALNDVWEVPGSGASPYAACIPNHPNSTLLTGEYTVWPAADPAIAGTTVDVQLLVKRSFGEPDAGLIHLDLYFTPGTGLTTNAASDSRVINFLDQLETIFLGADIAIGDVRYWNIFDAGFDQVGSYSELWDLFGAGATNTDRTLPIFFIDDFQLSTELLGITAHIPGPVLANGSRQAGVAVDVGQLLSNDIAGAAQVAAHEISHYLGLFHPTEIGATQEDPLIDTATCCDTNSCWATNLMDPYAYGNTMISADQRWVLLRHPMVELISASELPATRSFLPQTPWGACPLDAPRID